jgi:hypothetical protein
MWSRVDLNFQPLFSSARRQLNVRLSACELLARNRVPPCVRRSELKNENAPLPRRREDREQKKRDRAF